MMHKQSKWSRSVSLVRRLVKIFLVMKKRCHIIAMTFLIRSLVTSVYLHRHLQSQNEYLESERPRRNSSV